MPGLPDYKVEEIRERITDDFLIDKCDLYKKVLIPDETGSGINQWVLERANVPCRFVQTTFRAGQLEQFAGREYLSIIYRIYFSYNEIVNTDFRIYHNNKKFETRVFEIDMSDNLYRFVHVVEIL